MLQLYIVDSNTADFTLLLHCSEAVRLGFYASIKEKWPHPLYREAAEYFLHAIMLTYTMMYMSETNNMPMLIFFFSIISCFHLGSHMVSNSSWVPSWEKKHVAHRIIKMDIYFYSIAGIKRMKYMYHVIRCQIYNKS